MGQNAYSEGRKVTDDADDGDAADDGDDADDDDGGHHLRHRNSQGRSHSPPSAGGGTCLKFKAKFN